MWVSQENVNPACYSLYYHSRPRQDYDEKRVDHVLPPMVPGVPLRDPGGGGWTKCLPAQRPIADPGVPKGLWDASGGGSSLDQV